MDSVLREMKREVGHIEGVISLPFWTQFEVACEPSSRRKPGDFIVQVTLREAAEVTPAQDQAIRFVSDNQNVVGQRILEAVFGYYKQKIEGAIDIYCGDEEEELEWINSHVPNISVPDDLKQLLRSSDIFVHWHEKAGIAFVGFCFDCSWDDEHGLGVLVHNDQIIEVGHADIGFDVA